MGYVAYLTMPSGKGKAKASAAVSYRTREAFSVYHHYPQCFPLVCRNNDSTTPVCYPRSAPCDCSRVEDTLISNCYRRTYHNATNIEVTVMRQESRRTIWKVLSADQILQYILLHYGDHEFRSCQEGRP